MKLKFLDVRFILQGDQSTRELMIRFYEFWKSNSNTHPAFRKAQLEVMKKYGDPYYWAVFVVVGE